MIMQKTSTVLLSLFLSAPLFASASTGVTPAAAEDSAIETRAVDETQPDALALYAINLTNLSLIRISAPALIKEVAPETRTVATNVIKSHVRSSAQVIPLAIGIKLKLGGVPAALNAFRQGLDSSVGIVEDATDASYEAAYLAQKDAINQGLAELLQGLKEEGFTSPDIVSFVDATIALVETESPVSE